MDRNEEQNARIQLAFADKLQPVELTADMTLPDYRSEISRLLWVRPVMLPPTRFIGGGKVEFSALGVVEKQCLCQCALAEKKLSRKIVRKANSPRFTA